MNLDDTLYNWLSIKLVAEARPEDQAAQETFQFFDEMLREDHEVKQIEIVKDEPFYHLYFIKDGEKESKNYPTELIEALKQSIENEPRYN
ncbi:hypothetical protein [Halalkalibacterium ligniniphilum]|uniref:hypothetical protein n=1 Tax=Halalkalibacterium ligniniphilum TaxID=1134413 RepID=UPI0003478527|nr:hypothetical protein [Halalkalibacterium ligniniphilum]